MGRLDKKRALVTAAGAGIGKAIAEAYWREGADVIATDIDGTSLGELENQGIATQVLDAADPKAVADMVSQMGPVNILMNGVGIVPHGNILDSSYAEWRNAFTLNVDTMFHTIRAILPGMLAGNGGAIVNIASVASSLKGFPNRAAYGASKAAVIGLTKSVATDYVTKNIRCNAICPGTVESPSLNQRIAELGAQIGSEEEARKSFVARQPMGRLGTPEEIAAIAVYLASDEASYTTGQAFILDGGILG